MAHRADSPCEAAHPDSCTCDVCIMPTYTGILAAANSNGSRSNFLLQVSVSPDDEHLPGLKSPNSSIRVREESSSSPTCADAALAGAQRHKRALLLDLLVRPPTTTLAASEDEGLYPTQAQLSQSLNRASGRASANISVDLHSSQAASSSPMMEGRSSLIASPKQRIDMPHSGVAAARPPQNSSLTTASVTNATGSTMHPPTVKEVTSSGRPPLTPVVVEVGLSMEASSTGVSEICFVDVPCAGAHREDGVTTLEAAASPSIVRPTSPYSPVFIHDLDCASLQQCSLGHRNGWEENSCRPNGNMASVEVLSDPLDGENEGEDIPRPCSTATPPPSERFISLFHHLRVFMVCAIAISSLGCILLCILVMWGDIIISRPSMSHSDKNLHTALDVVLSVLFVLIVNVGGGALLSYYLLWRKGIAPLLQTLQLAKNAAHQFCSMRGLPITQVEDEVQSVMNGTRAAPCGIAYHTSIRDLADSIQHANTEVLCLRTYLPATLMEVMETHESAARSIREEVSRGCRSANASISTTAEHSIPNDGLDNTTDVVDMPWPSSHSRRRRPFRRTVMAQLEMEDMAFSPSSWNHSRMEEMSLQSWACQSMSPSPTGARRRQLRRPNSVGEMAAARVTPNVAFSEQNSHPLNDSATFASEAAVPPSINLGSDDYSIKGGAKLGSERLMSGGGGRALSCESSTAFSLQNVSYGSPVASLRGRGMQRQFPSLSDYPVRAQRGQTWRDAAGGSGTTDVLPNEEVGPWVTVLVCKLFLRDGGVVHPHMDRQEVDEIAQSSSSFHRCISSVASCSGGVTCALTMDSGLITYNAFSPIPMVSAMNTAYEAALLLHAKLNHAIPRRSSTSRHHIHQWGIVVHQSRMAVGYGGNNRFVFPYVYGPELILARELVDLTARLQCPILTLQPNFNTAKHYQLAPLDIVGVDYTGQQASVLYELLSRDEAGDQHTAESALILKGLLALHKYDFGGAKMILHDLATAGNRHANHILRTATYFEAALLSGTEMLPLPEPYCMERPRWDVTVDCGWAKQFDNCAFLHETSSVRLFTTPSLLAPNHDGSQLASRLMSSPMDLHTSQSRMAGGEVPSQPDMHGSPLSRGPAYAPSPSLEANIVATKNPLLSQHLPAKDHPIRSPPPPRPDSCSSRALSNTSPSRGYAPGSFPTGSQSASQRDGPDLDSGVFPSVNPLLATANFISPEIIAAVIQSASCYSTVYEQALRPYLPRCGVQVLYQKLEEDHPVTPITDEAKAQPMMIYVSHDHHPDFTTPDVCTGLREDGRMVHIQRVPATEEFQHLADSAIREVEILSHQQHDNIVRYLCCAFQDHCIYIISEHVAGGSLASMINLFGSLPMEVVRRYVADILHALVHLHHHKITHGGISSNSIRVSNGGQCKLAGFGHARQMAILPVSASTATAAPRRGACLEEQFRRSSISMLEKRLRTPPLMEINLPYVSPEACEGEANELNDIWSLGVVVYECLTGHLPWSSTSLADPTFFMESLIREGLPTPPTVPDAQASDFIRRCLLRTRDGRPSSTELLFHPFIIAQ